MIKHLLILCFLLSITGKLAAQKYGNEWINYTQKHYKLNIPKTGLYRIDYNTLINSGIPLASINPKNFQLFIKGQEQYITVNGEADNVFNTNDYIEFFGKKNDASFDSLAYENNLRMPNPYIPLFNDTNYAFITWNSSINNKRNSVETDVNFTGYTADPYFYSEIIEAYRGNYSLGTTFLGVLSDPRYVNGEGFGNRISKGANLQTSFGNLNLFPSSTLPVYIKTSYSGETENYVQSLNYDHHLKLEYLDNTGTYVTLNDTTFFGIQHFNLDKQLTSNKLQNNSQIRITSEADPFLVSISNNTNIHYITIKYPQICDLSGSTEKTFFVNNSSSSGKSFLDIQNVGVGTGQVILYDLTNHKYITTNVTGPNVKALIPNSFGQKECFLSNTSAINSITSLFPVNQTGFFVNHKPANPDSAFLIVTHEALRDTAILYQQYRQSLAGGSNNVILATVEDLYDQFAYGNVKNPLAIKNFCKFLSDSLINPPKYLLLIGKSIKNDIIRGGQYWNDCKVPTLGTPSSDNFFTTSIKGANSTTPFIPVGRISARRGIELVRYLNKVMTYEGNSINGLASLSPPLDWHKRVLHFSGGADLPQQQAFKAYLQVFGNIIKDTLYGGTTFSFQKNTTAPIQITVSDSVKKLIDYGCSIITFFGHGSTTGFDQSIDDPSAYDNKDKYPLFLANSCYSGDIHQPAANSTSEAFTLIEEKGSIGFIASSSAGVVNTLYYYTNDLYKSLAYETYYKGIGDAIKNTSFKTSNSSNQLQEITSLEMTLEGDPSIRLNAFKKPDYVITNSSVYFNTATYLDSIGINVVIKNNGRAVKDTFIVSVDHVFPNGDSAQYTKRFKAPYNNDTLSFFVAKDYVANIGLNHFTVIC